MENAMKIYCVKYRWEEMIEVIYEYIISNCENIFGVTNQNCLFRIEPDSKAKVLTVGVIYDGYEQFFIDYIMHNNLKDTGMNYEQLLSTGSSVYVKKTDKRDYLASNEIRYIKLNYNDIARLLITIVAQQMNLKKYCSLIILEDSGLYTIYISKSHFEYETVKNKNALIKLVDKTKKIVGKLM